MYDFKSRNDCVLKNNDCAALDRGTFGSVGENSCTDSDVSLQHVGETLLEEEENAQYKNESNLENSVNV